MVKGIIHQPYDIEDSNVFYAFSYYFDRAVDAGLIGEHTHIVHTLHNYTEPAACYSSTRQKQENVSHLHPSLDLTSYRYVVIREIAIFCQSKLKGHKLYYEYYGNAHVDVLL